MPMDAYPLASLPQERLLVAICSTTGQGEPPDNMRGFWQFLRRRDLPPGALGGVQHACFGLGDSSYPKFNVAARRLTARMAQLGSASLVTAGYGDEQDDLGIEQGLQPWLASLWEALGAAAPMPTGLSTLPPDAPPPLRFVLAPYAPPGVPANFPPDFLSAAPGLELASLRPAWTRVPQPPPPGTDGRSALPARVVANEELTTNSEARDVRHIELLVPIGSIGLLGASRPYDAEAMIALSPPPYEPGDSLGVWPRNSDEAVSRALARLQRTAPEGAIGASAFEGDALVEVGARGRERRRRGGCANLPRRRGKLCCGSMRGNRDGQQWRY
ncbi:flavoprotein-like protein, partial [Pavlovales sp. CCMP2436]